MTFDIVPYWRRLPSIMKLSHIFTTYRCVCCFLMVFFLCVGVGGGVGGGVFLLFGKFKFNKTLQISMDLNV